MKRNPAANLKKHEGFSLVELMVVLVIASFMSLAIFGIMASTESQKRTMTATNDATQAGNYAMYQLDKIIRAAGSGYGSLWQTAYGCKLFATHSNSQILPVPTTTTMAAPFASLNSTLKGKYVLAPLLIASQATTGTTDTSSGGAQAKPSDALIVMSGSAGYGEFPVTLTAATESSFSLKTYSGFNAGDLILEVNDTASGSASNCIRQQVASNFAWSSALTSLPLGGAYSGSPIGTADITANISAVSSVVDLGNATNGNLPSFQIIGVGANNVLNSYDLLQGGSSGSSGSTSVNPSALADSVFEMHALYYTADSTSGTNMSWQSPVAPNFDIATLESGTTAAQLTISRIKAIRLGLIMRSALPEKSVVTPNPITLFSDLGASFTYTRTLKGNEQNYRYRAIEATIPLRNSLFLTSE